ncbi:MAG: glycoside hydrolase family 16 protein, partial [Candidatus Sumerlaeota bacterium]|nr:glycoside hydrolase family 16 protein [Candidatus Sumerlaeota bacterium]
KSNYPGFNIMPASGASWDLSAYGHVEAKVTNTGAKPANITLRVDNAGDYHDNPWSCEFLRGIKPGETKTIKVIFGYSYGFNPNYKIKPEAIVKLLIFSDKSPDDRSFRIEQIQAAGPAGEKPAVNPANIRNAPDNGMILGKGVAIDAAKQIQANGGAKGTMADGSLRIDFEGKKDQSVTLRPAAGSWDLTQYLQVKVALKNTGQAPITPKARVDCGKGSPTNVIAAAAPLAPSAETEIIVPFAALVPWQAEKEEGKFKTLPGTGNTFHSGWVNGVTILSDKTDGAKSLLVTSIVAEAPVAVLPDWLGKRPPVEGEWVQTFSEEFDNPTIDLKRWNIYTNNYWDNRTHFSKDNTYIKDGKLILHFEKKKGYQNDNPKEKQTDYACGFADTYGKWVQRYGYWESRMKMTKAPGLWGAFWLMPDRGAAAKGGRSSTSNGGMEFDIQEFLDGWGPNRYNIAVHWDDYGPKHKSTGTPSIYFPPDKDGYMTAGLLWTPGLAVWYAQGKEVARWENPRVSTVQSYIMFDLVTGGWDNTPLEDSKLPDDYVIDYVRVWQRKDLASPVDGPQPNKGLPSSLEP